ERKGNRLVRCAMVGPKLVAIKRERARCERHRGEVFDVRIMLERIEPCDAPFFRLIRYIFVLPTAENIKHAIDKRVPTNFRAHIYRALNFSGIFDLMHISFVPLTEIKMLAVEAQIRAGEFRAGEELHEVSIRRIALTVTIVP